ncbi:uncharacterized protein LOC143554850 [Bidens hawaiensis]|uniref:uncharacterized protein LOC143554850 n=1 Tax=Bidens hawaiensis TaxID=980011 RepID=UPI004049E7B2
MFHEDIGHDTNECISLKNEIESAINSGKLDHLLKNVRQGPRKNATPADKGPLRKQIKDLNVHMIQGGPPRKFKRMELDGDEWKSEPVVFPIVKGGPCMKQPLIITYLFGHHRSQYVFFDTGSTSDIMYKQCFEQLDDEDKAKLKPVHAPIFEFGYEVMHLKGVITFPVTLSDGIHIRTEDVEFLVLPARSKHDIILGRDAIGDFNANPSTTHGAVGVPTRIGVAIILVNKHCYATEGSKPAKVSKKALQTEPEKYVVNSECPEQTVTIGATISETVRVFLKQLLIKNAYIFARKPSYITGVPREISEHWLRVNPAYTPIVQKRRKMGPEQTKAMNEQVLDLLHADIIREIQYQTWVSNPVMVPKSNGSWRMCIVFKDLNRACPKDCYPIPEIDLKVDAVAPFKYKCFLNVYKGYHQIRMAAPDEDKTAFHQIGKNSEVYMDDLVIKSVEEDQMLWER